MSKTGETVSFEYNEDGLRTKKSATSTGTTEYTLHGKNIVHLKNGSTELHFFYGAQNRPAVVLYNGAKYRYLYNLQGDVLGLIDESNNWVVEYRYDAWGKPTGKTGAMAGTLGTLQPFRYRGYVWDEETGEHYLRFRYYKDWWSRFINADYILDSNQYCYSANEPISSIDADGLAHISQHRVSSVSRLIGDKGNHVPPPSNLPVFPSIQNKEIQYPDKIGILPRNNDGSYSLYDNKRHKNNTPFHEQLIVLTPVISSGLPSLLEVGGDFDFITGGWEFGNSDSVSSEIQLLDFGHGEAKATLGLTDIEVSAIASIWSPSIMFGVGGFEMQAGAEVGSVGFQIGIGSNHFEVTAAFGIGLSLCFNW